MDRSVKIKITRVRRRMVQTQAPGMRLYCAVCQREAEMIAMPQALAILEVSELAFADLLATGVVHAIHTVSGRMRVCKDSLFAK